MVLGFSTKSKPKVPMYEEMKDTPWITRNRELNTTTYDNINRDLNRVNVFDDATKQQLNAYNDSIYNRAVSDFDRDYSQTMNKYLARDYNRFGTTGGASSLLTRDNYNLAQQRKLADMEYQRARNYEDMINQELGRRYKWLGTNYNYFTNSGNEIQTNDLRNWAIRNQNLDRQYANDVQDYNNSLEHQTDQLVHKIGGAVASIRLGPAGIEMGNAMSDAFASDAQNMLGGSNGMGSKLFGSNYGWGDAMGYLGAKRNWPGWSSGQLQGDQVSRTQPSSNSIMNFLSGLWDRNGLPSDLRGGFDNGGIVIG